MAIQICPIAVRELNATGSKESQDKTVKGLDFVELRGVELAGFASGYGLLIRGSWVQVPDGSHQQFRIIASVWNTD
ncbi:MAG TPA: hypothetical protein VNE82_03810 [Candidatus Binataceae bacterium]|nr:hypothetical protein [Candidatus Binataceae bacterium]